MADASGRVRELEEFALVALPRMQLQDGFFCYEVHAGDLRPEGRSLRYTLITLLGLQRAAAAGLEIPFDTERIRTLCLQRIATPEVTAGDLGLLLWACARAGADSGAVVERLRARMTPVLRDVEGLELSWIVIGAAEAGERDLLEQGLERQLARAKTPSGLFGHYDAGRRARFPNFATEIYGVLALATAARGGAGDEALAAARRAADKLLELQRPDGGWPWIFDVKTGRVVEPFEIYSVHQDAMAPMALLELSAVSGDERYRDAAIRGLDWVFGQNALGRPLLERESGILHRSIRRPAPFDRAALYANTALAMGGLRGRGHASRRLELNRTDRPYHLGWVLEAWAGREPE